MSGTTNYLSHKDVVAAVKDVLGIPRNSSLIQVLSSASAADIFRNKASFKLNDTTEENKATLIQKFAHLEQGILRFYETDKEQFSLFIKKVEKALCGNSHAIELVRSMVA